jgi:hypothetical protein
MSFANPFAPSLRRAQLQRTGKAGKVEQADHGENYSGWAPRIPRVNHLDPVERTAHIHNVESRRRRQQLILHATQLKADMRGDNEKALGPGVSTDSLDRWSRTRNLAHPTVDSQTKDMIAKDLQFIEKSKQQMARIKKEKRLPLPHVVARNPTWMAMHTETMQRSFSALGQLEGTGELTNRSRTGDLNSTQRSGTGTEPRVTKTINPDDTTEFDPASDEPSPFQRSVTFAATTDAIDNFWEQRESDLFN